MRFLGYSRFLSFLLQQEMELAGLLSCQLSSTTNEVIDCQGMRSIPTLPLVVTHCDVGVLSLISLRVQVRPGLSEEGAVWFPICTSASSCGREEAVAHHIPVARALGFSLWNTDWDAVMAGVVSLLWLCLLVGHWKQPVPYADQAPPHPTAFLSGFDMVGHSSGWSVGVCFLAQERTQTVPSRPWGPQSSPVLWLRASCCFTNVKEHLTLLLFLAPVRLKKLALLLHPPAALLWSYKTREM